MAKKKIINLSELSKYIIKDDTSKDKKEYGLGSWLGENAGDIIKTAAGTALTATGVAAPVGVGLMAQGATGLAANNINDPNAVNTIGAAGQVASAIPMAGQMANGGPITYQGGGMVNNNGLTEYNGGGTHEENPRGGIDVGATAQVEDKETRWEDYIFSDRLVVPGSKKTFAEESKRINDIYSQRENDSYDAKAKEREMRALMSIQENERERMDIEHQNKMNEMFACGGKMKHAGGGSIHIDPSKRGTFTAAATKHNMGVQEFASHVLGNKDNYSPAMVKKANFARNAAKWHEDGGELEWYANGGNLEGDGDGDVRKKTAATISSTTTTPNRLYDAQLHTLGTLTPGEIDAELYPELANWVPMYKNTDRGATEINLAYEGDNGATLAIAQDRAKRKGRIAAMQQLIANTYGLDTRDQAVEVWDPNLKKVVTKTYKVADPNRLGDDFIISKDDLSKLDSNKLQSYYNDLRTENAFRKRAGYNPMQYYGEKEAQQMGYNENTPYEDLNFGTSLTTGLPRTYNFGGEIQAIRNAQGFQRAYGGSTFKSTSYDMLEPMATPEDVSLAEALSFSQGNDYIKGDIPAAPESQYTQGYKNKFGDYAMLGAQNAGNLYNLYQGMQPAEQTTYERMSPKFVDYSAALKNLQSQYDSAANVARENIRGAATSSGQALSNTIAQDVAMNKARAAQESQIKEQEQNQNVGIANQANQYNTGIANQEMDVNLQNEARRKETLQAGLMGAGQSIAGFGRDTKAYQAQDRAMYDYMRTNNYSWGRDPKTGTPVMINNLTGQPV